MTSRPSTQRRRARAWLRAAASVTAGCLLVGAGVVAAAAPAYAAVAEQVVVLDKPGVGSFEIPDRAEDITVTLAGGQGAGVERRDGTGTYGGPGGLVTYALDAKSWAGRFFDYLIGAQGTFTQEKDGWITEGEYPGGGGTALATLSDGVIAVVGGGGGNGGGSGAPGEGGPTVGGAGAVSTGERAEPGGDGEEAYRGSGASGQGGQDTEGGAGGALKEFAGSPGSNEILYEPNKDIFQLGAGGAAAPARGKEGAYRFAGAGGSGLTGGGGGGFTLDPTPPTDDGSGGGGAAFLNRNVSGVTYVDKSAGVSEGGGSITFRFTLPALEASPPALPDGQVGVEYQTERASASGGVGPYEYTLGAARLPAGMEIDLNTGIVYGTPTEPGVFPFTMRVTDQSPQPQVVDLSLSVTITPAALVTSFVSSSNVRLGQPMSVTPLTVVSGGAAPFTWSLSSGSLPAGATLDTATGAITGTPTSTTAAGFRLRVVDSWSPAASRTSGLGRITVSATPISADAQVRRGAALSVSASGLVAGTYDIRLGASSIGTTTVPASGILAATPTVPVDTALGSQTIVVRYLGNEVGRATTTVLEAGLTLAPQTMPAGKVGVAYDALPAVASGGTAPLSYSVVGIPPGGLSIDATTGRLAGTPTEYGESFEIRVEARDSGNPQQTAQTTTTVRIAPADLDVEVVSPSHTVRRGQQAELDLVTVDGGASPFTYAITGDAVPGMTIADPSLPVLAGLPTENGTYRFQLDVTDSWTPANSATSGDVTVEVESTPLTGPSQIARGETVTIGAGLPVDEGDYTLLLDSTEIGTGTVGPDGTLDIEGTVPVGAASGDHDFVVEHRGIEIGRLTTTLVPAPLQVSATDPTPGHVGQPFAASPLEVSGGEPPYRYTLAQDQVLPAGLSLDAASGELSGIPSESWSSGVGIRVTDSAVSPDGADGEFELVLTRIPLTGPSVVRLGEDATVGAEGLVPGEYVLLLNQTAIGGGTVGVDGILSATGTIPDTAVTGSDELVVHYEGVEVNRLDVTVQGPELILTPQSLPDGTVGVEYAGTPVTASGGIPPLEYSFGPASDVPPGLSLDPETGELSGTPTQHGTFDFSVQVNDQGGQQTQANASLTVAPAEFTVTAQELADARVGREYSGDPVTATGGVLPYVYSLVSVLPNGLTLDADTGAVSGVPTDYTADAEITIEATDAEGRTGQATAHLVIEPSDLEVALTQATYAVKQGQPFDAEVVTASGGAPTYYYANDGPLPSGLGFDVPTSPRVVGLPADVGTFEFRVRVTDSWTPGDQVVSSPITVIVESTPLTGPGSVWRGDTVTVGAEGLVEGEYWLWLGDEPMGTGVVGADGILSIEGVIPDDVELGANTFHVKWQDTSTDVGTLPVAVVSETLEVIATQPPEGFLGQPYAVAPFAASGGRAPYTYEIVSGPLPDGLTSVPASDTIQGIPSETSSTRITMRVTDSSPTPQVVEATVDIAIGELTIAVPGTAATGSTLRVTGQGFAPGEYTIELHSTPVTLGTTVIGADGILDFTGTVPADFPSGPHEVYVLLDGGYFVTAAPVTITAGLPVTGGDASQGGILALIAALLVGAGLALRLRVRRRAHP